jgi:hypothetical protein
MDCRWPSSGRATAADVPLAAIPEDHTASDASATAQNRVVPDVLVARVGPDTSDQFPSDVSRRIFSRPTVPLADREYGRPDAWGGHGFAGYAQHDDGPARFSAGADNCGATGGPGDICVRRWRCLRCRTCVNEIGTNK